MLLYCLFFRVCKFWREGKKDENTASTALEWIYCVHVQIHKSFDLMIFREHGSNGQTYIILCKLRETS